MSALCTVLEGEFQMSKMSKCHAHWLPQSEVKTWLENLRFLGIFYWSYGTGLSS